MRFYSAGHFRSSGVALKIHEIVNLDSLTCVRFIRRCNRRCLRVESRFCDDRLMRIFPK